MTSLGTKNIIKYILNKISMMINWNHFPPQSVGTRMLLLIKLSFKIIAKTTPCINNSNNKLYLS